LKAKDYLQIIEIMIIVFALSWFAKTFIFGFAQAGDDGMLPLLGRNDWVFVDKVGLKTLSRKDIVVIKQDTGGQDMMIRRLIGLSGDKIEVRNGYAYVNDQPLYIPKAYTPVTYTFTPVIVPEGYVFLLNDNRTDENDSRTWGSIPRDRVIGKAQFCFWPWARIKGL